MSEEKAKKTQTAEQKQLKLREEVAGIYKAEDMSEINKTVKKMKLDWDKDARNTYSSEGKPKLTTGTILDDILGHGGIIAGKVVELAGEYATGKTQTVNTLLAEASQIGTVVLVNNERTFSTERIEQILKARKLSIETFWKNFLIVTPETWIEQIAAYEQIPSNQDLDIAGRPHLKLVVVDSLLCLLDADDSFEGRQKLPVRSRVIRVHLVGKLKRLAYEEQCVVIYTNQIQDVPDVNKFTPSYAKQRAKGGPTLSHVPDIKIFIRKSASDTRIARLMDSQELPVGERVFIINEKGIDDVSEELKKKIAERTKKEEKQEADNADKTDAEIAESILSSETPTGE